MANEATITVSLRIRKNNLRYSSTPGGFNATVDGQKGPVPGALTVRTTGTVIDLSELDRPGLCRLYNIDPTNFVTVGIYDGANFFPLLELLPGEFYVVRLARTLNEEYVGTGTGTSSDVNQLMAIADTADANLVVEAFES